MQENATVHHGPRLHLHPTVRTWDGASEALPLGGTIPSAPPTEIPLWHTCENPPRMAGRGIGFFDVVHKSNPTEEAN